MSVLRGLLTAMAGQSPALPIRRRERREAIVEQDAELPAPAACAPRIRMWSSGAKHSALIQVALAQKQVQGAGALHKAVFTQNQDIARICFSVFSRGKNSAQPRSVPLESAI